MSLGDVSLRCAWALVDGLVAGGLRHACVSPGSRSTPLALALARHPAVEVHVHLDERSSAFVALGIAIATGRPVAVACTSGTAAAELFPAVVEASQARARLVLLTADRPPRLRGTGANQTIDQVELYGRYARAYQEPPVPADPGDEAAWRRAAEEALAAMRPVPGPVQVNCAFEEPLTPSPNVELAAGAAGTGAEPNEPTDALTPDELERLARIVSGARGVVVVGGRPAPSPGALRTWSDGLGWPVIAESPSGARVPGIALAAGQAVLGSTWLDAHRPEVVVQLGATPTSRPTLSMVASAERLVVVDRSHPEADPEGRAALRLRRKPEVAPNGAAPAPPSWTAAWRRADGLARAAMDRVLDATTDPVELRAARDVAAWTPAERTLFVGNSSPVRDLDLAMAPRDGLRVLANRGASGIDGLVSTALGIGATGPVAALIGDLSFVHDVGALVWSAGRAAEAVLVVIDNGGGRLFERLDQRNLPEFGALFLTPSAVDLGALCDAARIERHDVDASDDLVPALHRAASAGGLRVVLVRVDPGKDRAVRDEVRAAIDASLAAGG